MNSFARNILLTQPPSRRVVHADGSLNGTRCGVAEDLQVLNRRIERLADRSRQRLSSGRELNVRHECLVVEERLRILVRVLNFLLVAFKLAFDGKVVRLWHHAHGFCLTRLPVVEHHLSVAGISDQRLQDALGTPSLSYEQFLAEERDDWNPLAQPLVSFQNLDTVRDVLHDLLRVRVACVQNLGSDFGSPINFRKDDQRLFNSGPSFQELRLEVGQWPCIRRTVELDQFVFLLLDSPILRNLNQLVLDPLRVVLGHLPLEVGYLRMWILAPELFPGNLVHDESVIGVGTVEFLARHVEQNGIRVGDALDDDLLIEALFVEVSQRDTHIAVTPLAGILHRCDISCLSIGLVLNRPDPVLPEFRKLSRSSITSGGNLDLSRMLPDLVDDQICVLVELVHRTHRTLILSAVLLLFLWPSVVGAIPDVRRAFLSDLSKRISIKVVVVADFFEQSIFPVHILLPRGTITPCLGLTYIVHRFFGVWH